MFVDYNRSMLAQSSSTAGRSCSRPEGSSQQHDISRQTYTCISSSVPFPSSSPVGSLKPVGTSSSVAESTVSSLLFQLSLDGQDQVEDQSTTVQKESQPELSFSPAEKRDRCRFCCTWVTGEAMCIHKANCVRLPASSHPEGVHTSKHSLLAGEQGTELGGVRVSSGQFKLTTSFIGGAHHFTTTGKQDQKWESGVYASTGLDGGMSPGEQSQARCGSVYACIDTQCTAPQIVLDKGEVKIRNSV